MSQTPDNSNPSNAAEPAPDTSGPTYVWCVNRWKLWLGIVSISLIPCGLLLVAWLLAATPPSPSGLLGLAGLIVGCFMLMGLAAVLFLPWRYEASSHSLVVVSVFSSTTLPRSAIRGVRTRYDPKRPTRVFLHMGRQKPPLFTEFSREREAIFDALASLYGTCECAPELEPDSPLWKSVADEYAEHAMFRVRYRFARLLEVLGIILFLVTIAAVIWRDAVFDWLFARPEASEPAPFSAALIALAAIATMACITLVASLGLLTILDLFRGGTIREITATRDALTIRRTLRTTIIPRDQILFVEPAPAAALGTTRVYVRGRAHRPTCKFSIRIGRGADALRFPAALMWLYGRAPTHAPSTGDH